MRFQADEHIRRRADFERAYEKGGRVGGRFMTVFAWARGDGPPRLGVAATRKIGGAVVRNRAKRLVRELFRQRKPAAGLDIVVVPRRELLDATFPALEHEFDTLVDRARRAPPGRRTPKPRRPGRPAADRRV